MVARTLSRWLMSIALAVFALTTINLLLATSPAQSKRAPSLINCSGPIQTCIDAASDGDTILIAAGRYTESLTLSKPVSLTGVRSDTTIIHAMAGQRVLTVTGATISNSVVISGLTFTGGSADYGGGVLITDTAQPLIRDLIFISNMAQYGGGMYALSVTLTSVQFVSNSAFYGGGLNALNGGNISDSRFERNKGGGLLAHKYGPLVLLNTDFISNSGNAGGVATSGAITVVASHFIGNRAVATMGGGGLEVIPEIEVPSQPVASVFITGTEFIDNAAYGGGGLLVLSKVLSTSVVNSRFEHNDGIYGGGLAVFDSDFTLINTDFVNNTAGVGSGAFIDGPGLMLIGGRFEGNNCLHGSAGCDPPGYGGGLVVSSTVTITGTSFINNSAAYQGGGIDFYGGQGRLINTLFARNSAPVGAAIAFESPGNAAILYSTFVNPTTTTESAIAVLSGTLNLTNTLITSHTIAISNTNGTVYEDYNLFFGNLTNTIGVITDGGHSLMGDPKFVDPLNGDYHLRFGSAAIDHGIDAGVYTDLDGNPRPSGMGFDIGAHEYQGIRNLWLPLIRK